MKKNLYYITLSLLIILSCNKKDDLIEINSQKTTELINTILSDSIDQYSKTDCITEQFRFQYTIPFAISFSDYVKEEIEIKNLDHLEQQINYYRNFKIDSSLANSKRIITKTEFENFEKESEKGNHQFWGWLDSTCSDGYVSISRPIFNEDFTKALVIIANVSCSQCGGGETRIYSYENGNWKITKTSNNWIS